MGFHSHRRCVEPQKTPLPMASIGIIHSKGKDHSEFFYSRWSFSSFEAASRIVIPSAALDLCCILFENPLCFRGSFMKQRISPVPVIGCFVVLFADKSRRYHKRRRFLRFGRNDDTGIPLLKICSAFCITRRATPCSP